VQEKRNRRIKQFLDVPAKILKECILQRVEKLEGLQKKHTTAYFNLLLQQIKIITDQRTKKLTRLKLHTQATQQIDLQFNTTLLLL
jgi:hypothetical protein